MAWQNSAAMGNGAGPGGGDGSSQGSQPQGTEYTLQGVMRFLQTQYHSFERERNAWEIERAEMKARIGKLEGEARTSKRMQESLGKHVKLLEIALRKERETNKKLRSGQQVEEQKPDAGVVKDFAKAEYAAPASKGPNAVDHVELSSSAGSSANIKAKAGNGDIMHNEIRQDAERDKSRMYLNRCLQELTYHVIPTHLAQQQAAEEQEQMLQEQQYAGQQLPQHSIAEAYVQQRMQEQANRAPAAPNHQPPPVPRGADSSLLAAHARSLAQQNQSSAQGVQAQMGAGSLSRPEGRESSGPSYQIEAEPEEQVESISHSYNAYGQPVTTRDDSGANRSGQATEVTVTEKDAGWDFDDSAPPQEHEAPPEYSAMSRPDQEAFPAANDMNFRDSARGQNGHRRKTSLSKRRTSDGSHELRELTLNPSVSAGARSDSQFRVRFALRGHVDVVRSVIFTGGGSPSEPEICTTGDDGVLKRWTIPASYGQFGSHSGNSSATDLDVSSYFTHRGHSGPVMCLAASPASQNFLNGGRAQGDGWVFSGGQDATVRVWERGRVDPKATLDGHTDAVWSICVLPGTSGSILGDQCSRHGGPDRILIASGAADGTILVWAVSSPPQLTSPSTTGSRRGGRRANSISSGSQFPSSPQATTSTTTPFHYSLVHRIIRTGSPAPTCISALSQNGANFVVSYTDASVIVYDTKTGEEIIGMASQATYDGTPETAVNAVAATALGVVRSPGTERREEEEMHGATGASGGVEGVVLTGHEDKLISFFDANSGQCTYNMIAHESAISALSLSPDGKEMVSAGHDASVRFWSLDKRTCTQEITSHRPMRSEGVCAVVWSSDGRWVVSGGGDGIVKVFSR